MTDETKRRITVCEIEEGKDGKCRELTDKEKEFALFLSEKIFDVLMTVPSGLQAGSDVLLPIVSSNGENIIKNPAKVLGELERHAEIAKAYARFYSSLSDQVRHYQQTGRFRKDLAERLDPLRTGSDGPPH